MSLKHNPFDNSYKGALVRRKKVFENPTPEELAIKAQPEEIASSPSMTEVSLLDSRSPAIRQPLDSNKTPDWTADRQQLDSKPAAHKKSLDSNKTPDWTADKTADRQPLDSHWTAKWTPDSLSGKEAELLQIIFKKCHGAGSLNTEKIRSNVLSDRLNVGTKRLRNLVERLLEKNLLQVTAAKRGNGSWRQFSLSSSVYQTMVLSDLDSRSTAIRQPLDSNKTPHWTPDKTAEPPCSSSNLNLSNTTTTDPTKIVGEVDPFWLIVPKRLDGLVSVKQLRDFVRQGFISEDVLQTSLDGFALDLEKGAVKAKNGNPVAILIGAIKGGGYISQQYLSELKASLAEVEKARAELHKLQAENVAEEIRKEFESFREKFPEQAEKMKPAAKFINTFQAGSVGYRMWVDAFKRQKEGMQEAARSELPST